MMRPRAFGALLVALQFAAIAVIASAAWPAFAQGHAPLGAWIVAALGAALGAWTLACNRPGNFNITPEPRAGGALVQHGPYRWIRHPMYSTVLAFAIAAGWAAASGGIWLVVLGLAAVVLAAKAAVEERGMLAAHPGYAAYRTRTRRFIPWLL